MGGMVFPRVNEVPSPPKAAAPVLESKPASFREGVLAKPCFPLAVKLADAPLFIAGTENTPLTSTRGDLRAAAAAAADALPPNPGERNTTWLRTLTSFGVLGSSPLEFAMVATAPCDRRSCEHSPATKGSRCSPAMWSAVLPAWFCASIFTLTSNLVNKTCKIFTLPLSAAACKGELPSRSRKKPFEPFSNSSFTNSTPDEACRALVA
mmetsp:Transcript_11765/g.25475  ORF Transcript_11765/g.25475 Transcript_11765/m.25475 type:complete len:208 (-) Transcript_11765:352-975(-)